MIQRINRPNYIERISPFINTNKSPRFEPP